MTNPDFPPPENVAKLDENYLQHWEATVGADMMPNFIQDLLAAFENSGESHLQVIANACARRHDRELIHEVHYLKGSLGNIGLSRASAFARQAEIELRTEQFARYREFPDKLREHIQQGIAALRERYQ